MEAGKGFYSVCKAFEGCSLKPYLCPAKLPTIGWGNTFYETGKKVTLEDKPITQERADSLLTNIVKGFASGVEKLVTANVNQNQFDALVDFAYNCGLENLKNSRLLKKVNANPSDPSVKDEFMKWVNADGKFMAGLEKRRKAEVELYFKA